jgi:hypothetical protein
MVAVTVSPYNEFLPALREHAENLAAWTPVWEARAEPDAHARRCASDAADAIDAMLRDLYLIRGQLTAEVRQADDATAARADALPARMREEGRGDLPTRDRP